MTENSAIFNARHGGGSFHPHRQPAPTAQDCLKRGTGANGERPGSYLVNVGLKDCSSLEPPTIPDADSGWVDGGSNPHAFCEPHLKATQANRNFNDGAS